LHSEEEHCQRAAVTADNSVALWWALYRERDKTWRSIVRSSSTAVEPQFTYTSIYVLLLYVHFLKCITLNMYSNLIHVLHSTQIWYTYFKYMKQSTYIRFEYVFRVILSFQFCKFFDLFFRVRHADEWQSTRPNSIMRKETDDFNFTLQ
jgi:hypothetical protein